MARPRKSGLDYFPLDADVFSDKKIRILYARFGADGFTLYINLLCRVFKEGYYITADDDLFYDLSLELNMSVEKIRLMLNFLLERSLFNDKLFKSDKVLTSTGIQRRYQFAVRERAAKNPITVKEKLWLLSNEETESFVAVHPSEGYSGKNSSYSGKNDGFSEEKPPKGKDSKEQDSKEKDRKVCSGLQLLCRNGTFTVDDDFLEELTHTYPDMDVKKSLEHLATYLQSNPEKQRFLNAAAGMVKWWVQDDNDHGKYRKPKGFQPAYDIAEYESTSVLDEEDPWGGSEWLSEEMAEESET